MFVDNSDNSVLAMDDKVKPTQMYGTLDITIVANEEQGGASPG